MRSKQQPRPSYRWPSETENALESRVDAIAVVDSVLVGAGMAVAPTTTTAMAEKSVDGSSNEKLIAINQIYNTKEAAAASMCHEANEYEFESQDEVEVETDVVAASEVETQAAAIIKVEYGEEISGSQLQSYSNAATNEFITKNLYKKRSDVGSQDSPKISCIQPITSSDKVRQNSSIISPAIVSFKALTSTEVSFSKLATLSPEISSLEATTKPLTNSLSEATTFSDVISIATSYVQPTAFSDEISQKSSTISPSISSVQEATCHDEVSSFQAATFSDDSSSKSSPTYSPVTIEEIGRKLPGSSLAAADTYQLNTEIAKHRQPTTIATNTMRHKLLSTTSNEYNTNSEQQKQCLNSSTSTISTSALDDVLTRAIVANNNKSHSSKNSSSRNNKMTTASTLACTETNDIYTSSNYCNNLMDSRDVKHSTTLMMAAETYAVAVNNVDMHNNVNGDEDSNKNNNNACHNNKNYERNIVAVAASATDDCDDVDGDVMMMTTMNASHGINSNEEQQQQQQQNVSITNNNSNKLVVDNARSHHDTYNNKHSTTATHMLKTNKQQQENNNKSVTKSVLESKVLPDGVDRNEKKNSTHAEKALKMMTAATNESTSATTRACYMHENVAVAVTVTGTGNGVGNGNHKVRNYEIHQSPSPPPSHNSVVEQLLRPSLPPPLDDTSWHSWHRPTTAATKITHQTAAAAAVTLSLDVVKLESLECELTSPRCQSRESNNSGNAGDGRCPSNESHCSGGNDSGTPAPTSIQASPSIGLPLPATLAPAAAAALLPPQSAAMAAYLNAAAAAAQQNHLLLTNPLAAAASLVQQATQSHSPPTANRLLAAATASSPNAGGRCNMADSSSILDFSTKRRRESENVSDEDEFDEERNDNDIDHGSGNGDIGADDANSPLDLSVSAGRKRQSSEEESTILSSVRKHARTNDYNTTLSPSTWVPPINPYLAAVAAASMSPKTPSTHRTLDWNGKQKNISPNEATKALEKMTEMTRLGSATETEVMPLRQISSTHATHHHHNSTTSSGSTTTNGGRHSAWQSHWLNKGADSVKDVFKCVWCKQSFPTLATLTTHMKETQHCGVNVPPTIAAAAASQQQGNNQSGGNQATQSSHHSSRHHHSSTQSAAASATDRNNSNAVHTSVSSSSSNNSKSDLNLLIKETMPLPRKLVRGQDVWLGKGAEQTRQILKCMWCGQSFRSLAEMTSHMQETQHYTNIISQEQIISWKSTDDKPTSSGSGSGGSSNSARTASPAAGGSTATTPPTSAASNAAAAAAMMSAANLTGSNATVSAVLTCKVCDQAFSTLKELSNHMVKNSHYKEHMMRTATAGGGGSGNAEQNHANTTMPGRRGRQTREKRKKSLPVRKLLELERAQQDYKSNSLDPALKPLRDFAASTKITCEKCGEKVETALFVDHIRQCLGGGLIPMSPRNANNNHKSPYAQHLALHNSERLTSPKTPQSSNRSDGRKTAEDTNVSPMSRPADILYPLPKDGETKNSTPSVLNAIEQLIEKSFDTRVRHNNSFGGAGGGGSQGNTPLGSSILKRLGIDDSVDYTKPLMDTQAMHFMRTYANFGGGRDRSASESSSVSERCSSRLESITPERNSELSRQATPRHTPEKMTTPITTIHDMSMRKETGEFMKIKSEPNESTAAATTDYCNTQELPSQKINVKKEFNMVARDEEQLNEEQRDNRQKSLTPAGTHCHSPSTSERSVTPKSTSSLGEQKKLNATAGGSSLTALSSMFDSLNNMNSSTNNNNTLLSTANVNNNITETNNNHASKKPNANPLAALQKLCETTDPPAANTRSNSNTNSYGHANALSATTSAGSNTNGVGGSSGNAGAATAGSMVAFSWACNDAVMTSDSIIKCSFCDTPFCSKGAYRHHLSKVHFVKDAAPGASNDTVTDSQYSSLCNNNNSIMKSPGLSPKSLASPKSTSSRSPIRRRQSVSPANSVTAVTRTPSLSPLTSATVHQQPPTINPYNESPQSKFLKYTELAKQLSSKNV